MTTKTKLTDEQRGRVRKWVDALRSGEYKQGMNRLRNTRDQMCCLGVACDLYHKETGDGVWGEGYADGMFFETNGGRDAGVLPGVVMEWLGMPKPNPQLKNELTSCAGMNDRGESFESIADAIEAEFLS